MNRSKEDVKRDLVNELYWDHRVDANDVQVEVLDGEVRLTGTVPSFAARKAAALDAWNIRGVSMVSNLLKVKLPPSMPIPSDKDIESNARMALASHPDIYSLDVDIIVEHGRVRLEGTVDTYWKHWRAEEIISDLRGVVDVENHLAVVQTANFLDKDIATDIEAALERNIYVDAEKVIVKVARGKATLTGTLPTYYARNRAYESAAFTSGVTEVENNIIVS